MGCLWQLFIFALMFAKQLGYSQLICTWSRQRRYGTDFGFHCASSKVACAGTSFDQTAEASEPAGECLNKTSYQLSNILMASKHANVVCLRFPWAVLTLMRWGGSEAVQKGYRIFDSKDCLNSFQKQYEAQGRQTRPVWKAIPCISKILWSHFNNLAQNLYNVIELLTGCIQAVKSTYWSPQHYNFNHSHRLCNKVLFKSSLLISGPSCTY